jgi:hypothetical protein
MQYVTYIGLDLGQASDPSAITVIESPVWVGEGDEYDLSRRGYFVNAGWNAPGALPVEYITRAIISGAHEPPILQMRGLKRYMLGTPYPKIVEDVVNLMRLQRFPKHTALCIDRTGVGAPVFDMFVAAGLEPIGINITGGDQVHEDGNLYRVPKRDLVGAVQSLLQHQRIKFAERLPELATLKAELKNFRVKIDPKTAHDSYSAWRENQHDDLVLAVALACWFWQWSTRNAGEGFCLDYTGRERRSVK